MIRTDFSGGWLFAAAAPGGPQPPQAEFIPVDLPHDWQIRHADDLYRDGTLYYRKQFACTPAAGERVALWFGGAYMDTAVLVNGREAGQWKNGYTSFWFDITGLLQPGENEVLVRCELRHPNSRWYSGAGLFRTVQLWRMPAAHLMPDGLYVAAREGQGNVWTVRCTAEIGLCAGAALPEALDLALCGPEGDLAACRVPAAVWKPLAARPWRTGQEQAIYQAEAEFTLPSPRLWDLGEPNLYRVEAALGGPAPDTLETKFGCRTIELSPDKGLLLNHRHVYLRGVCLHHDFGCLGAAFEPDAAARQLRLLQQMGANSIRTGHVVPDPQLMDLADEMGFLINDEIFDCWRSAKNPYDYARFFDAWQERDVAAWVRRDRNHPSLLFWSIGNEIYDTHAGPEGADTMRLLMAEVAEHDPERNGVPTFGSNYLPWPNTQACADIIKVAGYNYGERMYAQHHAEHPDWIIYGSETASVVMSRGVYHFPLSQPLLSDDDEQCSSLGNSRTSWGAESLDICLTTERHHPYTLGQYLWTGWDYIGEPTPYHTRNSYFGMVDTAGFPKDAFYVVQAAWLDPAVQPMVHLFPYWDWNPGQTVDVCACTNAASVELFLDGESLGRRAPDPDKGRTVSWQVAYRPGTLRAVAYDEQGAAVAQDERRSFGDSAALCVKADRTALSGDGRELAFLTITAADAGGNPVANANDRVTVQVRGAGVLVGLDNGDSTDPDEYQTTSRRLFSGMLLAVVAGNGSAGEITVEVSAPGLRSAVLALTARPFAGPARHRLPPLPPAQDPVRMPVRKLELTAGHTRLTPSHSKTTVRAVRLPAAAGAGEAIEWKLTDDRGDPAANAVLHADGDSATVEAKGDGALRVRAMLRNGRRTPQFISQLDLQVEGLGQLYTNPYDFVPAGRYEASYGDIGNGNERGISTSRTGRSWVLYRNIDFGPDGSDTVELPIFSLDGEPTAIRFWDGEPYVIGSTMIGERIYHKPKMWNVYQPDTFRLDKRLTGVGSFAVELNTKVHIKGFRFKPHSRAFDTLAAGQCDAVNGDSFTRAGTQVLGIGNNVSLTFRRMDFGKNGCSGVRLRGRSALPANTVHLLFDSEGPGGSERRIVEFGPQPDWGEQTFHFAPVKGKRQVTFLFLPGTQFDFDSFTFLGDPT